MLSCLEPRGPHGLLIRCLLATLVLTGCGQGPASGPAEIAWDRDTCSYCGMVISDRAHAAEIRGGPRHKLYKFDDLGCALNWLQTRAWSCSGHRPMRFWIFSGARDT